MIVLPAIDIKGGQCVRLRQGEKDDETVYFKDPVKVAKQFESWGAQYLHIVDLDGAFNGKPQNFDIIKKILSAVDIPIELGGGIRNAEIAKTYIDAGVSRIIVGTQAIKDFNFIEHLIYHYDNKVCVSIDARDGMVRTEGWTQDSDMEALELATSLEKVGLSTLVYTDISKDGMMSGPNFDMLNVLNQNLNIDIIASGGVASVEHLDRLRNMDLYGAITGKAVYEGAIDLKAYFAEHPNS
ncbi:1-(5-phosphoribosyl)-5-[(5-phosphoribosylamino)methylideneamino]imidazole-4-carboxamide isomerase [Pseudoramibacter sp.]|jgi:phosphoribosylformimino-5-aminoimidazole carboxamide ribotide isomerase|uniref:1-(5-phosphoribosyl)-5-[(5- phosphoribosylamino)methylideneamino]imidazole-4- carboxamide isomerase n=1 Tax=Pseudoramibacter sp. TaxID=2034862 RepID=UPI0025D431E7|nr:1-(5-phosphoribosyl)-5-[(5-phosphoribosylamino)methylideneamino]imidazole-4-carboxamide isomerase [Pseudoramibacter sp.]MCH4071470.1 1-(5-phosphoribosyl)-5-[(5-phosphoribosylamino)methylideneamino]imidazole-4-carboxamide isomerase [Pseudoramibacter sp.]MCH4105238.1 1-(5-phosphoribosyl)-5-[(5-phosphoribosylamino)methylideneamino]imidazole-4-carboxamide isomerase [Pseudoramibacter sp.]